jgi:hypothetical protein
VKGSALSSGSLLALAFSGLAGMALASCGSGGPAASSPDIPAATAPGSSEADAGPPGGTFPKITKATPEAVKSFVRQIDRDHVLSVDALACIDTNVNDLTTEIDTVLGDLGVPDPTNAYPASVEQSKVAANAVRVELQQVCGVDVVVVQDQANGQAETKLSRP